MGLGAANTQIAKQYGFLQGCGEMGELIAGHNWADTPLGSIETWPVGLKILLSTSLKAAVPMVVMWGDELTFFYNDAYRPILGNEGKHPAVLGTKAESVWPEGWAHVQPLLEQVYRQGASVTFQDMLVPVYRNGRMQDVYWSFGYSPARDEEGNIRGVFIVCDETTQRVTKLQNVVERTSSPIVIFKGEELIIEEVNQATLNLWRACREDIIGRRFTEVLPEMGHQSFPEQLREVYRTGETHYGHEVPAYFRRSNGEMETLYFNFEYSPYKEANGDISGVICVAIDVTNAVLLSKQAEEALGENERRFRTIIENAAIGIGEAALDGTWIMVNDSLCRITGYPREELMTLTFRDITHPDDLEEDLAYVRKLLDGSLDSYVLKKRYLHKNGSVVWINLTCSTVKDEAGKPKHAIAIIEDITKQHEAEEKLKASERMLEQKVAERTKELEQLNRALALSNQELEQFAYVASHDLQEPLRKIKAFGDMLANNYNEQLGPSGTDLIGRMQSASNRMSALIEDVLSFSRVSTRKDAPELVDASLVLKETIQDLETAIFEKNAMIIQEPLLPIVGSKHQIRQLFQNLLSNALKFSKEGVQPIISISSKLVQGKDAGFKKHQPEPDERYQLIEVKDNGIGFESEYAEKIFQIFQRLHGRSAYAGSGVGLAIVQKVVLNHHGLIEAESRLGEGALFRILLPLATDNHNG